MKRIFTFLATVVVMTALSGADARNYFGVRLGYPELGVQLGSTNFFSREIGGRVTADFGYYSGSSLVLGADVLYNIPISTPNTALDLNVYLGGGLGLVVGERGFDYNVHGVLGIDVLLSPTVGVFLETRPAFGGRYGYFGAGAGINFRL
jgi:hypothetical protein